MIYDPIIEVFPSEVSITCCSEYFKDAVIDREERNVEGSTPKIVYNYLGFATFFV